MNKIMRIELLVITAGKEIKDGEICVIGQGVPMAAGAIAKKTQAPNSIILTEAGMIDIDCFQNLESVGDPGSTKGYSYCIDLWDVFTTIVNRGHVDLSILGCAQMDKFGNINSTVIGKYDMSRRSYFRLPGSGGANEFAGHSKRTVYTMVGGKFTEKLDYLTTPGWLSGGDSRRKAGLPGGPSALITKHGVFRFEEVTKEIYLDALFPQTTVEEVKKLAPWDLKTAEDFGNEIKKIPLPKKEEIEYIREFEPFFGISGNLGRRLQSQVLPVYYEQGNVPHE
ncbi:MAG: CoA-transferase subunit beta [Promethearchaeota archaeon]